MSKSAPMDQSEAGPSQPRKPTKGQINNQKYGIPLPLDLGLTPDRSTSSSLLQILVPSLSGKRDLDVGRCNGVYDPVTRSVWVTERRDMDRLFRRGFFGKGTLSRSEPTWRDRRIDLARGGDCGSHFPLSARQTCPTI